MTLPFTIADLETDERFKVLSFSEQQDIRNKYFTGVIQRTPEYQAASNEDRQKVYDAYVNRLPVFANDEAPEVVETRRLIEAAKAGDQAAYGRLYSSPFVDAVAKGTLIGTAATWTIDKIHNLIDPDNTRSEISFTLGKEGEKLNRYIVTEIPELKPALNSAAVLEIASSFAETAAMIAVGAGGAKLVTSGGKVVETAARGFAKPIIERVAPYVAKMASGPGQRFLASSLGELTNALVSGALISVKETTQLLMRQEDPFQLDVTLKRLGADIAIDVGVWATMGVAGRLLKFMKRTSGSENILQKSKDIIANWSTGYDVTPMMKQMERLDPDMASKLQSFMATEKRFARGLTDNDIVLQSIARSKNFDVVPKEVSTGKLRGVRYDINDLGTGDTLYRDLPLRDVEDFLAKELGPSQIRFVQVGHKQLWTQNKIKLNMNALKNKSNLRVAKPFFDLRHYTDDPSAYRFMIKGITTAEGLSGSGGQAIRIVDVDDFFDVPSTAAGKDAPERIMQWGMGYQDASGRIFVPTQGVEGGGATPEFAAWYKSKVDAMIDGEIAVPTKFMSTDQKRLYENIITDSFASMIAVKNNIDISNNYTKLAKYYASMGHSIRVPATHKVRGAQRAIPQSVRNLTNNLLSPVVRQDFEATSDIVNMAWGQMIPNAPAGGPQFFRTTNFMAVETPDGAIKFRVSVRPVGKDTRWQSIVDDKGVTRLFETPQELRAAAFHKIIEEGRISDVQLQSIIALSEGYRVRAVGDVITSGPGAAVQQWQLELQASPLLKRGDVSTTVVASANSLKELFQKVPQLYDVVGDASASASAIKMAYNLKNPYITIAGRALTGSDNDIYATLRNLKEGELRSAILKDLGFDEQEVFRKRFSFDKSPLSPKLVYNAETTEYFVRPINGGRTLRFGPRGKFSSEKELSSYINSNVEALRELEMSFFAFDGSTVIPMPNGSLGLFDDTGLVRTFKNRAEINDYLERDIFSGLEATYQMGDDAKKAVGEILGAHDDYNARLMSFKKENLQAYEALVARQKARAPAAPFQFSTPRKEYVEQWVETEIIMPTGKRLRTRLDKPQDFGWELTFRSGTASKANVAGALQGLGLKAQFEADDIVRVRVGGNDLARAVAQTVTPLGVAKGLDSSAGAYKTFDGPVTARFINYDGTEADIFANHKDLSLTYRSFYAGGQGYDDKTRKEFTRGRKMKDMLLTVRAATDMYIAPVSEATETMIRRGVPEATEFYKIRNELILAQRMALGEMNQLTSEINSFTRSMDRDTSAMLGRLWYYKEADWDKVAMTQFQRTITDAERTSLKKGIDYLHRFLNSNGITIDAATDLARVSDYTNELEILGRRFTNKNPIERLADLPNKFGNVEGMPIILKVFSDTMRPDQLSLMLRTTDFKTFLNNVTKNVIDRKYLSIFKEPVGKLFVAIDEAKRQNRLLIPGVDKYFKDTIDQFIGIKDMTEEVVNGVVTEVAQTTNEFLSRIPAMRGFFDPGVTIDFWKTLGDTMTYTTQGGKLFNVVRNGTQIMLQAGVIGTSRVLNAQAYVLDHPEYIAKAIQRVQISQGMIESVSGESLWAKLLERFTRGVGNSEIINRATSIRAAETLIDDYLPRLRSGLETPASFIKATHADVLYDMDQQLFMDLIAKGERDAAADFLGVSWENLTHFLYGPAHQGKATRGAMGKLFGKFITQGTNTVAYASHVLRSKMPLPAAILAVGRIIAIMEATRLAFEKIGIQYDGFGFLDQFNVAGGPGFQIMVDTLRATRGGDEGKRSLQQAARTAKSTLIPLNAQYKMAENAIHFADYGRIVDAFYAAAGAPLRTDDQLRFLETFKH